MDSSSTKEPNANASNSPFDRIPVEIVIEIVRLSLLQVEYHHVEDRSVVIMRRVEELRLVDTYWAKCIDQCPTFWTHITSQATPARYTLWLKKSQNAPLHVDCFSEDGFIELLLPHAHRWQSLTFVASYRDACFKLTRPAPQLQELDLFDILSDLNYPAELFQGVIPRLNTLRYRGNWARWHLNIFRGLRELVLEGYPSGAGYLRLPKLDDFLQVLELSPSLEVLFVKRVVGRADSILSNLDPVTLPSLRSFVFETPSYFLLGLIRIPNCTSTSIKCESPYQPIFVYSRDAWAAVIEILRLTAAINISVYPTRVSIATKQGVSPLLNAEFICDPFAQTMLFHLLWEAELFQPLPTAVDLTIESPAAVPAILDFLADPAESGSKRLPKLQRLYLKLHKVPVDTVARLILDHEELQSVKTDDLRFHPLSLSQARTLGHGS